MGMGPSLAQAWAPVLPPWGHLRVVITSRSAMGHREPLEGVSRGSGVHSFNKYLLNTHHMPGTVPGYEQGKQDLLGHCAHGDYILEQKTEGQFPREIQK